MSHQAIAHRVHSQVKQIKRPQHLATSDNRPFPSHTILEGQARGVAQSLTRLQSSGAASFEDSMEAGEPCLQRFASMAAGRGLMFWLCETLQGLLECPHNSHDPRQSYQEAAVPFMIQSLRQHMVTSACSGGWK